jgi:hypothetical protein
MGGLLIGNAQCPNCGQSQYVKVADDADDFVERTSGTPAAVETVTGTTTCVDCETEYQWSLEVC